MKHKFVILKDGQLETYSNFDDIPMEFDNLISFLPSIPPEPHTEEQHKEIESWNDKLKELLERETWVKQ